MLNYIFWAALGQEVTCKVRLDRTKDYYWRVRAANEYGMAEPSMPAMMKKKEGKLHTSLWCVNLQMYDVSMSRLLNYATFI